MHKFFCPPPRLLSVCCSCCWKWTFILSLRIFANMRVKYFNHVYNSSEVGWWWCYCFRSCCCCCCAKRKGGLVNVKRATAMKHQICHDIRSFSVHPHTTQKQINYFQPNHTLSQSCSLIWWAIWMFNRIYSYRIFFNNGCYNKIHIVRTLEWKHWILYMKFPQ